MFSLFLEKEEPNDKSSTFPESYDLRIESSFLIIEDWELFFWEVRVEFFSFF